MGAVYSGRGPRCAGRRRDGDVIGSCSLGAWHGATVFEELASKTSRSSRSWKSKVAVPEVRSLCVFRRRQQASLAAVLLAQFLGNWDAFQPWGLAGERPSLLTPHRDERLKLSIARSRNS